ncbi:hypothetical protein OE88DRAFT_1627373 [Heliocybe sulcata]|uniref:NYN domain-containing protein n=1 Tax=Heliocybe sulcata TaxID=5364 RepID=A0A5C3N6Y6_9AGAM|nr:hypothetical protein OE88DRAFT_1627373 [Heliocybe sulcata]
MDIPDRVAIFWDHDNIHRPASISGDVLAGTIRAFAHTYGPVTMFKAYMDLEQSPSPKSIAYRSTLQTSGVTLVDCPHNGSKDAADKMIIVDMLAFALDHPVPATVILISGDCDFAYAVSTLRLRGYEVVIIAPKPASTTIKSVASLVLDWDSDVLGRATNVPSLLSGRRSRNSFSVPVFPEPNDSMIEVHIPVAQPPVTTPESVPVVGTKTEATDVTVNEIVSAPSSAL